MPTGLLEDGQKSDSKLSRMTINPEGQVMGRRLPWGMPQEGPLGQIH